MTSRAVLTLFEVVKLHLAESMTKLKLFRIGGNNQIWT